MLHEPGQGAFQLPRVGADHGDAQQGVLGMVEMVDLGDGDVVMVMPSVLEGADDFPLIREVESIADSQFQLQDSDQHSGQRPMAGGQKSAGVVGPPSGHGHLATR